MKTYFDTKQKKDCTGCGVCALICPKKAITMKEDSEGFLYPVIDENKCINCGLCKKKCPSNIEYKETNTNTYIAISNDKKELLQSASGGMFYVIGKTIIKKDGVVFGVAYDKKLKAVHGIAKTIEDLKKFRGSKYVRSDLKDSYLDAEKYLKENKLVLFTGTPCQCQGLRSYLKKDYDNLITCEILCHANPSPKVFELYKKNIELIHNKKIKEINFRSKENGWKNSAPIIKFTDGTKIEEKSYYMAFVSELINRPSCHNCNFASQNRYSDITIGDLWGIDRVDSSVTDDNTGISLLNINTEKGRKIFEEFKNEMFFKEADTTEVFSYNHNCNVKPHKKRERFFKDISLGKINETNIIKYMNKYTHVSIPLKVIRKIKYIIKK